MRRLWKTLLTLLLILSLPAAGLADVVAVSFYPIELIALNLCDGLEGVEVRSIAAPGTGCLHDYQLSAGDMRSLAEADVFLINGAGMESYLAHVMEALPELPVVDASAGIELLPSASGETPWNAHIWLSPRNAAQMAENLAGGLCEALPAHAGRIRDNLADFTARMNALDAELRDGLADLPHRDIVTFHEAFPYFAKAYDLNVVAVVALEPDDALSPRQLAALVETVRGAGNPPLFTEPQYTDMAANAVSAETGAAVWELDPCVTGPESDIPLTYYEDVMRRNLQTLREALS